MSSDPGQGSATVSVETLRRRLPVIPGMLTPEEFNCIEVLGNIVPENGVVVEVGSLLGLSSCGWSRSVPASATVFCIDPWEEDGAFSVYASALGQRISKEQFLANTKDCNNVIALRGYSPQEFQDWNTPVDLYFEDAVHIDPMLGRNLSFWSGHVRDGGTICGHDYGFGFPDVVRWVERLADEFGRTLRGVGSLWCLLPNSADLDLIGRIKRLPGYFEGAQADRHSARLMPEPNDPAFATVVPEIARRAEEVALPPVTVVVNTFEYVPERGRELRMKGSFTLAGLDVPVVIDDYQALAFGVRVSAAEGDQLVTESRSHIAAQTLEGGSTTPFEFIISLPLTELSQFRLEISPVYERAFWWFDRGVAPLIVEISVDPRTLAVTSNSRLMT